MDTIFTLNDNEEFSDKLNLDELYERKKQQDLNTLNIYNKILSRIHNKIKVVSKQSISEQFCWYVIPEVMIGIPKYDNGACIAYIIDKLKSNGFIVKYTHPNLLFISWKHWIPGYVRNEIKKKTGIIVDGYGNKLDENNEIQEELNPDSLMIQKPGIKTDLSKKQNKDFKDINAYKPIGSLVYNKDLIKKLEDKLQ
jgi:hypothetical protein